MTFTFTICSAEKLLIDFSAEQFANVHHVDLHRTENFDVMFMRAS